MSTSNKTKKRAKPPKGRPASTSTISQPVVEDASNLATLSSFSLNGNHFAFVSLAVDKHRLRVYNTVTGQSVAEHIVESARVSTLAWSTFDPSEDRSSTSNTDMSPHKKKKRKRDSLPNGDEKQDKTIEVVLLGLSDGTILLFSHNHGRVLRTVSHPSSTAEILSAIVVQTPDKTSTLWTSGADGAIRLWNVQKNEFLAHWHNEDRIPYSCLRSRPEVEEDRIEFLAAHHNIRLLSTPSDSIHFDIQKPTLLASYTGHASEIQQLQWDVTQTPSTRFLSLAKGDRFLYVWDVPESSSKEGKAIASIPLDSEARTFSLAVTQHSKTTPQRQILLVLSASGKVSLFPIPSELAAPVGSKHKLPTLLPRSNITTPTKISSSTQVINAAFSSEEGSLRVARLHSGIRPIFEVVRYLDESGDFIPDVTLKAVQLTAESDDITGIANQRYAEISSMAVGSGTQPGQGEEMDDFALREADGDLDVDLAELSLGQRLTALSGAELQSPSSESDGNDNDNDGAVQDKRKSLKNKNKNKANDEVATVVPASSLTRTLIQALHSSDSRLLETCLRHSDQTLIRNTVRRLPPQLSVLLITACVERLGRGAKAANMKGGGGGASSQRGMGLVTWIKTALTVHSGYLMTIPDLVAKLSGLHATLTARLALQESLLSLSGKLEMVISQIELRSSAAPTILASHGKGKNRTEDQSPEVKRYVEGESSDEDEEDQQMEVEIESGDDEGSVEDVELGGDSEEDDIEEEDDDEEDDDEEDDDDDDEEPTMNGFIDDEAEEYSGLSEDEEESE